MASASQARAFVERIYSAGRNIGLSDVAARIAAAQAANETGYGRSVKGNNYFGIKAGSSWKGGTQTFRTWEEVNGKRVDITDKFRKYDTPEQSLLDWAALMERRFPGVLDAKTFEEGTKALKPGEKGGYATDTEYNDKLAYINERFAPEGQSQYLIADGDLPKPTPAPFDRGGILSPAPVPSLVSSAQAAEPPTGLLTPKVAASGSATSNLNANAATGNASPGDYGMLSPGPWQQPPSMPKPQISATGSATANAPVNVSAPAPVAPPAPVQPSLADQYAMYGAGKAPAVPATPPADYQQPAFTNQLPKIDQYGQPPIPGLQPAPVAPKVTASLPVAPPPVMTAPPRVTAPLPVRAPEPQAYFPPTPPAPPPATGMDVWTGQASRGTATDGSTIFSDPSGQVYRYDPRFDKTVAQTPDGPRQWQGMYNPAQGIDGPLDGAGIKAPSNPFKGLLSEPETKAGSMVRTGLGAAAGGMAGSALGGPVGAMLGAWLGKELANGRNPIQSGQGLLSNTMQYGPKVAQFRANNQGYYPQNYYPKAPRAPNGSQGQYFNGESNHTYAEMAAISPRAADAIVSGKPGLF